MNKSNIITTDFRNVTATVLLTPCFEDPYEQVKQIRSFVMYLA